MISSSPGTSVVADTMAIVLWLEQRRLPAQTRVIFLHHDDRRRIVGGRDEPTGDFRPNAARWEMNILISHSHLCRRDRS